jgi:hypothetical protein
LVFWPRIAFHSKKLSPWVFYSGRVELGDKFPGAVVVTKLSAGSALVGAITGLLEGVEPIARQPTATASVVQDAAKLSPAQMIVRHGTHRTGICEV